jgi:mRNA-degrading endonuclease RelE of RelBE toxin-antitoxin system
MNYDIIVTDNFKSVSKKLIKKYSSLKNQIEQIVNTLSDHPETGDHLGSGIYKIRLKISSKRRGKSGEARLISYVYHFRHLSTYSISTIKAILYRSL